MKYCENDRFEIPERYRKMSLKQIRQSREAFEKEAAISSKNKTSAKRTIKTNIKFNF